MFLDYLGFFIGVICLLYVIVNIIHHINKGCGCNLFWLSDQWSKDKKEEPKQ